MPAFFMSRRRVEIVVVPLVAAFCMAFIIGAIVLDRDRGTCPPATWSNNLTLNLTGNTHTTEQATSITACFGADCIPLGPAFAKSSSGNSRMLKPQPDGSWLLKVGARPASNITFRVFDQSGRVLASKATKVNWTRVSGNERCGGRMADVHLSFDLY